MGLPSRSLSLPTNQPTLPVVQLFAAGIVMPLAFTVANQYLLNFQWKHPPDGPATAILWLLFVSQIGVISVVGAHLAQKSWHGWAIYIWCSLLIDLQVFWTSSYARSEGVHMEYLLLTALLAAQAGLVVVWSILGEQQWTIRVPLLLGLAVVITLLLRQQWSQYHRGVSYSLLFLIQILGLYAICSLLRYRGFCLGQPDYIPRQRSLPRRQQSAPQWPFPAFRFGLREFIVVAALFAVILVAWQYWLFAGPPTANKPLNLAFAAVLTTLMTAVAFWSALGAAPIELRIAGLLATCVLTAAGCIVSDALFGEYANRFTYSRTIWEFWSEAFASRGWIFAWMFLSGGLLFAALLLLRMLGYRLARVVVAHVPVENLHSAAADLPKAAYALLAKER